MFIRVEKINPRIYKLSYNDFLLMNDEQKESMRKEIEDRFDYEMTKGFRPQYCKQATARDLDIAPRVVKYFIETNLKYASINRI